VGQKLPLLLEPLPPVRQAGGYTFQLGTVASMSSDVRGCASAFVEFVRVLGFALLIPILSEHEHRSSTLQVEPL